MERGMAEAGQRPGTLVVEDGGTECLVNASDTLHVGENM